MRCYIVPPKTVQLFMRIFIHQHAAAINRVMVRQSLLFYTKGLLDHLLFLFVVSRKCLKINQILIKTEVAINWHPHRIISQKYITDKDIIRTHIMNVLATLTLNLEGSFCCEYLSMIRKRLGIVLWRRWEGKCLMCKRVDGL